VRINAQRLEWVPAVLSGLGVPFVIERPDALREVARTLAAQLTAAADNDGVKPAEVSDDEKGTP